MPEDLLPVLIALSVLVGFIVAVRGYMLYAAVHDRADDIRLRRENLQSASERLSAGSARLRSRLAATNSDLEHALWRLPQFDERITEAAAALRERRALSDRVRVRYLEGSRRGMARVRQTLRLIEQLHRLRRTFLG